MSADRDQNIGLRCGVNYSVDEMLYLLEVDRVQNLLSEDSKKNLELTISTLEVLPNTSLVRFEADFKNKTFHLVASSLGLKGGE